MPNLALGIDVGGSTIQAGLVDSQGEILESLVVPTFKEKGADYVLKQIVSLSRQLIQFAGTNLLGLGVALPGEIDCLQGICLYSPNLKWRNQSISDYLIRETGLAVRLVNDANAACLGEYYYGYGKNAPIFLSITLGTGVGSGLILNGKLYTGRFGSGLEAGHMVIEPYGKRCACGRRGCWETLVAGPAIVTRTKEALERSNTSILSGKDLTTELIFQAARQGDCLAEKIVAETIFYLAVGLANLINLFNPYKISLGGGVSEAEEIVGKRLREKINNYIFPTIRDKVEIYKAKQSYWAGLIGAASLWLQSHKTH